MDVVNRAGPKAVALETTLLLHGVPRDSALPLADELESIVLEAGARPALVGLVHGRPTVGMTRDELVEMLDATSVPKANTSNLGVLMHQGSHAATTVSATMELALAAGVRVFATGGIGGVHPGYGIRLDISSDLAALSRFPVGVVCSGVKSILDVVSTREALETLGVPAVGFGTDRFPGFYLRDSGEGLDGAFEDAQSLAGFLGAELSRTGRGVLIANPIPAEAEVRPEEWAAWLAEARRGLGSAQGRDVTPALLGRLHELSGGATLRANLALIRSNTRLASELAATVG